MLENCVTYGQPGMEAIREYFFTLKFGISWVYGIETRPTINLVKHRWTEII